ncbi:MAG: FAD-dependent oxidoreductase [Oscillospiraceae bacterium]|nr:FAD-dependent oxidoreductase [Oscillospiraceae bacterium]
MAYEKSIMDKVREIAQDCQGGHMSFCNARCPMHTDATRYIEQIRENKLTDAVKTIREKLFLPGTLGRVCAHPCELECRRNTEYGQPISIAALKRYAADKADSEELWDITKKSSTGKKVAVIGAGPAGAQAAIDISREGHAVTIYEKLTVVGGMMRVGIPEYRLPRNLIDFEYSYLTKLGIEFKLGVEVGKDISFDELSNNYDAVVLANGAHKSFVPPVKGIEADGITNAVDFLRGVSLGENAFEVKGKVLVIGGGDVTMDCARTSVRLGAQSVTVASLECEVELPASGHEQHEARQEGVFINCGWGAEEILSEGGSVKAVVFKQCLSVFDAEGRFAPTYGEEKLTIQCDTLIFATGQMVVDAANGALDQGAGGRYIVDRNTLSTKIDNVFVAGDSAGGTIVVEAMALGRKAAISVNRLLSGVDLTKDRDFKSEYDFKSELDIPLPKDVKDTPRNYTKMLDPIERTKSFVECDLGFDESIARAESERCLKCECKECMKECIMFNDFTLYPGALFKKFLEDGDMEPIIAYSCNMCDQCTLVCPKEFKFAELFGAMRKDMVKANHGQSPMPGHKAINMHQKLGFSKLFTVRIRGGSK